MAVYRVEALPGDPLDAAAAFHARDLPEIRRLAGDAGESLVLVFAPADHTHRGWRLAAVQSLARELAPQRVNGVAGYDAPAIDAAMDWIGAAPGVTGQYWPLDATGATCA